MLRFYVLDDDDGAGLMPRTSISPEQVQDVLRSSGGRASMGDLTRALGVHRDTVRKHLEQLIARAEVQPVGHGQYQLAGGVTVGTEQGNEILRALDELGFDAHLTGFDLLTPYAHQFVFQFPHLVYTEPSAREGVAFELARRGFVIADAGLGAKVTSPELSNLVIARTQPNAEQYGVRWHLASIEKAWVDTLRETIRGNLPFEYMELGRILRTMLDSGADARRLRTYARRLGYLDRVEAALQGHGGDDRDETRALRAGFLA